MSPKTDTDTKPAAPAKTEAKPDSKPVDDPKVETTVETGPEVELHPTYEVGQQVVHANGETYTVRQVFDSGIALVGVANLVDPAALRPAEA